MAAKIICGDVFDVLPTLAAGSVDVCVTSPPYWMLRDYGTGTWEGGNDPACDHKQGRQTGRLAASPKQQTNGAGDVTTWPVCGKCGARRIDKQLGMEPTVGEYVARMVEVFRLVRRAMAPHATCWVNIGDSYASGEMGRHDLMEGQLRERPKRLDKRQISRVKTGIPDGNLCLIPSRLALALQADGWIVRSVIIWQKKSPMPQSLSGWRYVKHRVKVSRHEYEKMQQMRPDAPDGLIPEGGVPVPGLRAAIGQGTPQDGGVQGKPKEVPSQQQGESDDCRLHGGPGESGKDADLSQHRLRPSEPGKGEAEEARVAGHVKELADGGAMERNQSVTERPLLLVQEESEAGTGSRHSGNQGRGAYSSERGRGVPKLQRIKGNQDRDLVLIDCPGCDRCLPNSGYVLRRGSWRPTSSYEPILMLAKGPNYYADGDAVRTPAAAATVERDKYTRVLDDPDEQFAVRHDHETVCEGGANLRDVWTIASESLREKHYAAFPSELVYRCLAAGTSARGYCPACSAPWARVVETKHYGSAVNHADDAQKGKHEWRGTAKVEGGYEPPKTLGWRPSCQCPGDLPPRPGMVLDCFAGSGRTGVQAQRLGLDFTGVELSPEYARMAERLLYEAAPLFQE